MYAGATLRDANLDVFASPRGNGTDFSVDHDGRRFYIEAITPEQMGVTQATDSAWTCWYGWHRGLDSTPS
jgi:hypothetical protein